MKYTKWFLIAALLTLVQCSKDFTGVGDDLFLVRLQFKNFVGNEELKFNDNYTHSGNETFKVTTCKYYISNIRLSNNINSFVSTNKEYYLVDQADPNTQLITFRVNGKDFTSLNFTIGVDSVRNVSGAQTGALDPAKGMFWTWNSGYIMAKLEGTSPASTQVNNVFQYHIGGFRTGQNTVREISLPFPGNTPLQLKKTDTSTVVIKVDINKWFNGPYLKKIAENAVVTTPGTLATQFADNYSNMFSIISIINK